MNEADKIALQEAKSKNLHVLNEDDFELGFRLCAEYRDKQVPAHDTPKEIGFGVSYGKMFFNIGVQKFTLDYEPITTEDFDLMKDNILQALSNSGVNAVEKVQQEPVASQKDAVFDASIEFIETLTGIKPPPIEVAPPEVFEPFRVFTEKVCAIFSGNKPSPSAPAQQEPVAYTNKEQLGYLRDPKYGVHPMAMWASKSPGAGIALYTHPPADVVRELVEALEDIRTYYPNSWAADKATSALTKAKEHGL